MQRLDDYTVAMLGALILCAMIMFVWLIFVAFGYATDSITRFCHRLKGLRRKVHPVAGDIPVQTELGVQNV